MRLSKSEVAFGLVLLTSALAGCPQRMSMNGGGTVATRVQECKDDDPCKVAVTASGAGDNCVASAPDKVIVDKSKGARKIRWEAPAPYKFSSQASANEGIHFKTDPGHAIVANPGYMDQGAAWRVVDTPDPHASQAFEYRITLVAQDGTLCKSPDPVISNQ